MSAHLHRSIHEPIRTGLSRTEIWNGHDKGLIWCWERGRQMRIEEPESASRADKGELLILAWKGGVEKKLKEKKRKEGTLKYLATWQGLRGANLDIALDTETPIVCSKFGQTVFFSAKLPKDDQDDTGA